MSKRKIVSVKKAIYVCECGGECDKEIPEISVVIRYSLDQFYSNRAFYVRACDWKLDNEKVLLEGDGYKIYERIEE